MPSSDPIVAMNGLSPDHVPPAGVANSVAVSSWHIWSFVPHIGLTNGFTLNEITALQPCRVKVMSSTPADSPSTRSQGVTVDNEMIEPGVPAWVHVPPLEGEAHNVTLPPLHTLSGPVITGIGFTEMVFCV